MTQKNTTFFSSLLANLKLQTREDIPTAATDGIHLYYNYKFIEGICADETLGLLLHEVMHVALEHTDRRKSADLEPERYNVAGDYVINNDLDRRSYKLPKGGLIDHKYDGWSTREVYDDLPEATEMPGGMDIILTCPEGMTETEHREHVITNVVKAVTQAKLNNDIGSVPGEILRKVELLLDPVLPWNVILQNYMSEYIKEDYTWKRPNRRYQSEDMYLPSQHSEALTQITAAIDVSGSISDEELKSFMSEIRYIWDVYKPRKLRILGFDTEIHDDMELTEGDMVEDVRLCGGGGTDCSPVVKTLHADEPEVAIIFTDGQFYMPNLKNLISDIIWVLIGDYKFEPSHGEVIRFNG
jgi:predicted metal-dependent peptidase